MRNINIKQAPKLKVIQGENFRETSGLYPENIKPFIHREIFLAIKNGLMPAITYRAEINKNNMSLNWSYRYPTDENTHSSEITNKILKSILTKFNRKRVFESQGNMIPLSSLFRAKVNYQRN